jgi:hypothetical protein
MKEREIISVFIPPNSIPFGASRFSFPPKKRARLVSVEVSGGDFRVERILFAELPALSLQACIGRVLSPPAALSFAVRNMDGAPKRAKIGVEWEVLESEVSQEEKEETSLIEPSFDPEVKLLCWTLALASDGTSNVEVVLRPERASILRDIRVRGATLLRVEIGPVRYEGNESWRDMLIWPESGARLVFGQPSSDFRGMRKAVAILQELKFPPTT